MIIQHFEKGFHYTDKELLQIARKVGKLATYCKRIKDEESFIRIEAEKRSTKKDRDQIKVTILVELPKKTMKAESRKFDAIEAVDRCIDKLEPQVKKFKEKQTLKQQARRTRKKAA